MRQIVIRYVGYLYNTASYFEFSIAVSTNFVRDFLTFHRRVRYRFECRTFLHSFVYEVRYRNRA